MGRFHRQSQPEYAAPVLADQSQLCQVEMCQESQQHIPVKIKGVNTLISRFIRPSKTEEIGCDHSSPAFKKGRDHVTVKVEPGGLTVETQIGLFGIFGTKVNIMTAKTFVSDQIFDIVRFEFIGRKVLKSFFGCA